MNLSGICCEEGYSTLSQNQIPLDAQAERPTGAAVIGVVVIVSVGFERGQGGGDVEIERRWGGAVGSPDHGLHGGQEIAGDPGRSGATIGGDLDMDPRDGADGRGSL